MSIPKQEILTHPDVVELAEEIAQRIQTILEEDDGVDDRLDDLTVTLFPDLSPFEEEDAEKLAQAEQRITKAVHSLLRPMVARIFETGDWHLPEPPAVQHCLRCGGTGYMDADQGVWRHHDAFRSNHTFEGVPA